MRTLSPHVWIADRHLARAVEAAVVALVKAKRGSLVYTDKFGVYDALTFCGYRRLNVDHGKSFTRGRVHINGLEGLWSYAKTGLIKHHGVSPLRFPLYLYEMQFRYDNRKKDLFELILDATMRENGVLSSARRRTLWISIPRVASLR